MPLRESMADIISRVRTNIGDASGASQVFTDQQIQDVLDARTNRRVYHMAELEPLPSRVAGDTVYLAYRANHGNWEDDPVLADADGTTVVPDSLDLIGGEFGFVADQEPPLYITGRVYDLSGASADLLQQWLAKLKLQFGFVRNAQEIRLNEKYEQTEMLMKEFRRTRWPRHGKLVRDDLWVGVR